MQDILKKIHDLAAKYDQYDEDIPSSQIVADLTTILEADAEKDEGAEAKP